MKPLVTLLPAAALCLAGTASAQIDFQPAQSVPVGLQPDGTAIADFDGDGDADLAATVDAPDRVVVFAQNGGSFALLSSVLTGAGSSPHRLAAADLDGDGDVDLAVTLQDGAQARILLNDGGGSFTAGQSVPAGAESRDIVAGDFEGDGDVDLAVANRDGNSITLMTNSGAATFTSQTVGVGLEPRELTLGDFDGDGDLDAATSAHDSRRVDVVTNNGGTFTLTQSVQWAFPLRPEGLTAADLDGDGDVDLAGTSSDDAIGAQNTVGVMLNSGGAFSAPQHWATGGLDSSSIEAGDLDGDGDADLVVANSASGNVTALTNGGGATFGTTALFGTGAEPTDLVLGDVDGNGSLDAVTANEATNNLSVLLNDGVVQPAEPTLQLVAPATVGGQGQLLLTSPGDAGKAYFCGFSGGTSPGITLSDGSVVPLNPDGLFTTSTNPFNPFFQNGFGAFDGASQATVLINVPDVPQLAGLTVFAAFVTFEPASPTGFGTISPALSITVAP